MKLNRCGSFRPAAATEKIANTVFREGDHA
jgi:hypothetical protein